MNLSKISQAELNLSVVADGIVTNAGIVSYHLFCPFCADFYLFEFTLKEHLKREHSSLIQKHFKNACTTGGSQPNPNEDESLQKRFVHEFKHLCDLCGAMFMRAPLVPKHILNYHGSNCFMVWQQQQQQQKQKSTKNNNNTKMLWKNANNENMCEMTSKNDTNVLYGRCSAGLSEMFEGISTHDNDDFTIDRTPLKSILKKSASKSARIISSPSSSSIRRIKNSASVKRASKARRVLRFDIANTSPLNLENLSFGGGGGIKLNDRGNIRKVRKTVGKIVRRIFLGRCGSGTSRSPSNSYKIAGTSNELIDDTDD